ncbi:general substrate transporter [Cunninghamella echinulata]|nr:general substrate transporter [Cunninghamella echinulata]
MPSFLTYFNIQGDSDKVAQVKGTVVSLLQVGCCIGAILSSFVADPLGRKKSIMVFAFVFLLGGILQVVANRIEIMMVGRCISGLGIGSCSMLVPMYLAEIASKSNRGKSLVSWQLNIVIGIFLSYWVDYACIRGFSPTNNLQWRLPLIIQLVPGIILFFGIMILPESLRWLADKGKEDQLKLSLLKLREVPETDELFQEELQEILTTAKEEADNKKLLSYHFKQKTTLHRLSIGILLQVFQQLTFTNGINYYAPNIFRSIGLTSNATDILATGIYGAVKVLFVIISYFLVDGKYGRRRTLIIGSIVMFISLYGLAIFIYKIQQENGGVIDDTLKVGVKGYLAIFMVYLFAAGYEFSFGPIPWLYCSELFPTAIRAVCLSITTFFNWAFNAAIAKITPIMMTQLQYGTYFFFGTMCLVMGVFVYLFVPETRGKSLEEINQLFNGNHYLVYKSHSIPYQKVQTNEEIEGN